MRSGEILGLRWSEVDLDARLLNLPATRMKAGVAFRVPLSDHAAAILSEMPHTNELVFPGRSGKRLSAPIFERILKRLEVPGTPHGIRSAFAGWAAERGTALEVIDASLAHRVGTAVTRAYVRGDFLPARRSQAAIFRELLKDKYWAKSQVKGRENPRSIKSMREMLKKAREVPPIRDMFDHKTTPQECKELLFAYELLSAENPIKKDDTAK
jgi:hypothetical protein